MSEPSKACHMLVVEDKNGRRSVSLDAATISIGRDATNSIVLDSMAISRQHAFLLRLPLPKGAGYRYRLVDGNSAGQPSTNGVRVNGEHCSSRNLENGDEILFGEQIKAQYQILSIDQNKYARYLNLDSPEFHSIKAKPLDAKATLHGEDLEPISSQPLDSDASRSAEDDEEELLTELICKNPLKPQE